MASAFVNKEFLDSCKSGNVGRLKEIYNPSTKSNINIDFVDDKGKTGFIHSIEMNYREIANFLIEQQCDVNVKDVEGKNALHYAADAQPENKQLILFLLMNGCDSSNTDASGKVPGAEKGNIRLFIEDVDCA